MGKETEKILELLHFWQEYTTDNAQDLKAFGIWLSKRQETGHEKKDIGNEGKPFRDRYIHKQVPLEDQIVLHWGRLQRFTHLWSRKALKDLPINSMEEFGLIKSVELIGKARKSDLVQYTLLETTTCFEMIKRLVKSGYLQEEIDSEDRRSRLVYLTEEGKQLSADCDNHVRQLSRLLIGNINLQQKQSLLEVLRDLDNFHGKLYENSSEKSLKEMLS